MTSNNHISTCSFFTHQNAMTLVMVVVTSSFQFPPGHIPSPSVHPALIQPDLSPTWVIKLNGLVSLELPAGWSLEIRDPGSPFNLLNIPTSASHRLPPVYRVSQFTRKPVGRMSLMVLTSYTNTTSVNVHDSSSLCKKNRKWNIGLVSSLLGSSVPPLPVIKSCTKGAALALGHLQGTHWVRQVKASWLETLGPPPGHMLVYFENQIHSVRHS